MDRRITREIAETVGIKALGWLAGNEELLPVFLGATGASAQDLRTRATDAEFLGYVLEFLMMNDAWVVEFCQDATLSCEVPMQARQALPGGAEYNWT